MLPRTNVAKPRNVPHDKLSRSFFDGWKIDTDRCSPSVENRVETILLILSSLAINTIHICLFCFRIGVSWSVKGFLRG